MKHQLTVIAVCLAALCTFSSVIATEPPSDSAAQAKMMEYMQLAQPGEEHSTLAKYVGKWNLNITFWMEPGAEPVTISVEGENKMILGGRFLQMTSTGSFMGMPMETFYLLGFDRRGNKFNSYGFDTQGTYGVTASGAYINDSTIRLSGTDYDAFWDFTQEYYFEIIFIDDDHFTWIVTFTDERMAQGQEEFMMVKIEYSRIK